MRSVTVATSPLAVPAVPRTVSTDAVTVAPPAGPVTATTGALVSTVNVAAALVPTLPEVSDWVA